MLVEGQWK